MTLTTESSERIVNWFSTERGITPGTLKAWGVEIDGDTIWYPYPSGRRYRRGLDTDRKFGWERGSQVSLFGATGDSPTHAFLVEGETDAMRLKQELGDSGISVYGLPGIETWRDEWAEQFRDSERVWIILDNDKDYNVRGRVDTAWHSIRFALGSKAKRVKLPPDVKDVCEFFDRYDKEALRMLCERRGIGASRFKALDLTKEPPEVEWLVTDLICRGDIHLVLGEPGIGKSWLTMSLSLAVASGSDTWLSHSLRSGGRVLYLDEENPEDLIFDRFRKLGMRPEDAANIRYINNEGIRLDRVAEDLLEEALDYEPTLIVLDSLTRFHTEDENNAGAMSKLFNNALKPLARETKAAVVLIHHANKTESNSSYKRSRGSGDITASVDSGIDVREVGVSTLALSVFKSRRRRRDEHPLTVQIVDTPDGGVTLLGGVPLEVPF